MLTKTQRVFEYAEYDELDRAVFVQRDEDDPFNMTNIVSLDSRLNAELDYPETITVTIEPGDKLNGKGVA